MKNGDETDIDCGGSCSPCANGRACTADGDCAEGNTCDELVCNSCGDGVARRDAGEAHAEQCGEPGLAECPVDRICVACRCEVPPPATPAWLVDYGIKQLRFSWAPVAGATYYRVLEDADGASGYAQVGGDLTATSYNHDIALFRRAHALYQLAACNEGGCTPSAPFAVEANLSPAIGYFKASDPSSEDSLGYSVALSASGTTLVIGAPHEDGSATGVGGLVNDSAADAGAVYVFERGESGWQGPVYIKAWNTDASDYFGFAVALCDDGNTLAVGAPQERGSAVLVDGEDDDLAALAGAVYVYRRTGSAWEFDAYVKASNTGEYDRFGWSVALSGDCRTLAAGALYEAGSSTGVGGSDNDGAADSGAVYVYRLGEAGWGFDDYVKASNTGAGDRFGVAVALSADGATLAVGAMREDSNATGVGGTGSETASDSGAAYVYRRSGSLWSHEAYIKGSPAHSGDLFGNAVALSGDGNTLAVGARLEDSNAVGIDGDSEDTSATSAGAVFVFVRSGATWSRGAYVKASNTASGDNVGHAVALAGDGNTLATGATGEDSCASGIGGSQTSNTCPSAGAVYLY